MKRAVWFCLPLVVLFTTLWLHLRHFFILAAQSSQAMRWPHGSNSTLFSESSEQTAHSTGVGRSWGSAPSSDAVVNPPDDDARGLSSSPATLPTSMGILEADQNTVWNAREFHSLKNSVFRKIIYFLETRLWRVDAFPHSPLRTFSEWRILWARPLEECWLCNPEAWRLCGSSYRVNSLLGLNSRPWLTRPSSAAPLVTGNGSANIDSHCVLRVAWLKHWMFRCLLV